MEFLRSYLGGASSFEQARCAIDDRGLERLGDGFSSVAYSIRLAVRDEQQPWWLRLLYALPDPSKIAPVRLRHEDRVIRVTGTDEGMTTTTRIAMEHQDDPYAPKIYEYQEFRGGHAVIMERLEHYEQGTLPYTRDLWCTPGAEYATQRAFSPGEALRDASPYVAALCHAQVERGLSWDLHVHNVMRRPSDGHLVIQDPLVG